MKFFATCALVLSVISSGAFAAVELPSNIRAKVNGTTSFDNNTGLYTYNYSVTNYGDSPKSVHEFHIPLRGATILNLVSPAGWEAAVNRAQTMVGWCACREDGFVPPAGYVNDGRGIPSQYVVMPGVTLSGFSFQSPYPPSPGIFHAGGWVPILVEGIDFPEGQEPVLPEFPMNLLSGEVTGPSKSDAVYLGERRPAVDGFLVFMNVRDGETYSTPVIVDILLSQNGENVLLPSFKASLNGPFCPDSKLAVLLGIRCPNFCPPTHLAFPRCAPIYFR